MTGSPSPRTGWLWPLLTSVIFTHTALNLARPLISYRTIAVGGDAVAVGLITAAYALLPLLIAVPVGRMTDRARSTTWIIAFGGATLGAGCLALAGATNLAALAVASTIVGVGHLLSMVAGQGLMARLSPPERMDRDFGWFTAAASLGQLAGPLISGVLLADASGADLLGATTTALVVAGVVGALGLVPVIPLLRVRSAARSTKDGARPVPAWDILRQPRLPSALLTSLALLSAVDILTAYLPLIAESRGISPMLVGVLLSLRAGFSLLSRLVLPWLLGRWSRKTLVVSSTLVSGISLALVALPVAGPVTLAIVLSVGGFLLGLGQPLTMAQVATAAPPDARATALALRLWGNRLGQVAIPAAAAAVAGATGAPGALLLSAVVLLGSATAAGRAPS
ncbi:MFS transporter [Spiractinospora alimapuensis]|uniref:MFS transporter n=1 Tax=Spiractinospora alimapuensis TaxID=2820884 RepID=UPI001F1739F9|nr:MFS transporter [Spiractinospora alimapuensis]QVQ52190.1 MFS transporter [Spiractinospora alimapuensis]